MHMETQACSNPSRLRWLSLAVAMTAGLVLADAPEGVAPAAGNPAVNPAAAVNTSATVVPVATGTSQVISLTLDDVPLAEVVRMFMRISGANIIAATSNLQGQVTANLQDQPWRPAFESILERQGLQLTEKPPASNIFVIDARRSSEDPRVSTTVKLNYAKVADVTALITSVLSTNGGSVTPFPSGNTIVLNASAQKTAELQKIITEIDVPRTQVSIETKIVQLTDGSSKNLGIDWQSLNGYDISAAGGGSGGALANFYHASANSVPVSDGTGAANIPNITPVAQAGLGTMRGISAVLTPATFNVVLSALAGTSGAKTISNPKIIVANEEKALIKMAVDEPNIRVTVVQSTGAGVPAVTTEALDSGMPYFTYGITVEVTPRVNTASNITVTIKPELSAKATSSANPTGEKSFPDGNSFPIIDKKSVQTVFSLADGSTAAIGLITTTDSDSLSKIPLLGDIPSLGDWLFSYKGRTKSQTEVLIFVTVRLIDPKANMDNTQLPSGTMLYTQQHPTDSVLYMHSDPVCTNTAAIR